MANKYAGRRIEYEGKSYVTFESNNIMCHGCAFRDFKNKYSCLADTELLKQIYGFHCAVKVRYKLMPDFVALHYIER